MHEDELHGSERGSVLRGDRGRVRREAGLWEQL